MVLSKDSRKPTRAVGELETQKDVHSTHKGLPKGIGSIKYTRQTAIEF